MNKVIPVPSLSETGMPEGIVTLSDSHYYPGLETLYLSVQECYPLPLTCYDIGLKPSQIEHAGKHYPLLRGNNFETYFLVFLLLTVNILFG